MLPSEPMWMLLLPRLMSVLVSGLLVNSSTHNSSNEAAVVAVVGAAVEAVVGVDADVRVVR